jgi:hypothetical protein
MPFYINVFEQNITQVALTKREVDAKCTLCCYQQPAIYYKLQQ